jgi:hypothetical protein
MSLQLSTSITIARSILNDTDSTAYRYSDADLLQYGNDAIDQMTTLIPSLFYVEGEMECTAGALQTLSYNDARAIVAVRNVKDGAAVLPCTKETLDRFDPAWITSTAGTAKNWMAADAGDPARFYVYPPAPAGGQYLMLTYIAVPPEYSSAAATGIPATYADAVADYIVFKAESRDDEHVVSQRAQTYYQSFVNKCSGG